MNLAEQDLYVIMFVTLLLSMYGVWCKVILTTKKGYSFLAVHSQLRLRSFLDKFFENSESETLQEARVPVSGPGHARCLDAIG